MSQPHVSANSDVEDAAAVVRSHWNVVPRAGIILGTGLGSLAEHIEIDAEWSYRDLPHFAHSTADSHRGRWLCGRLAGVPIVAMDGRFHLYEGYSPQQVAFPVRVMTALGARWLIASNASGGLNPTLNSGEILLIEDHVNLQWSVPCRGQPATGVGRRSRYSPSPYDPHLLALAERIAAVEHVPLRRGVYVAMLGPNYETRAEYRWLRTLGDVVGMSTVPEVLIAAELGLSVIAFSMVTNVFRPDDVQQTTSEGVIAAAAAAEPNLRRLVMRLLAELPADSPLVKDHTQRP